MALAAYRQILRATRVAFQGDARILHASRIEARSRFDSNRSLSRHSPESEQKISEAEEIARILRQNIVQGKQMGEPGAGDQRYHLRIHEEVERGDNESIKTGANLTVGGTCCGGGTTQI